MNALVAGNGSYIVRPCGLDLHVPTLIKHNTQFKPYLVKKHYPYSKWNFTVFSRLRLRVLNSEIFTFFFLLFLLAASPNQLRSSSACVGIKEHHHSQTYRASCLNSLEREQEMPFMKTTKMELKPFIGKRDLTSLRMRGLTETRCCNYRLNYPAVRSL